MKIKKWKIYSVFFIAVQYRDNFSINVYIASHFVYFYQEEIILKKIDGSWISNWILNKVLKDNRKKRKKKEKIRNDDK